MLICRCNEVSKQELNALIKKNRGITLEKIIETTGASTKCGRCKPLLQKTFEQLSAKYPPASQLNLQF
ncbi:MAG: (2Fe-2S)-binding protein [Prolixibacteraceae bacterium]|jgi:NAD(P)H-nitrite reductase large subunit|nr:(2Fe-2S)-binding protein [Prolixibacteraceae bacterium]